LDRVEGPGDSRRTVILFDARQTQFKDRPEMASSDDSRSVSTTLLERLIGQENDAYARLQFLFRDTVTAALRRKGVPERDVEDLCQNVFLRVWRGLPGFKRDGQGASFRRWLHTITRNVALDYFRQPRAGRIETDQLGQIPESLDDDTAADQVGEVHRMLDTIRGDFNETTFQIFVRYWLEGRETDQLAGEYGMKKGAVREARNRVMKRLRETYFDLYGEEEWPFSQLGDRCGPVSR
jgi:RNA polymerase sigma-70 factor, ECF subfamily